MPKREPKLFCALLRHFRYERGVSQLSLALEAEISNRHLSFLETGRSQPRREMVLVLGNALDLPLRDRNALLEAAGFEPAFDEPPLDRALPPDASRVLDRMLEHHEPFPMFVLNRGYDVLRSNDAAARVFAPYLVEPPRTPLNLMRVLFDPLGVRSHVIDWPRTARLLLSRLHREALSTRGGSVLQTLVDDLLRYPDVPPSFRKPDLGAPVEAAFTLRLSKDERTLTFVGTVIAFSAPQNVTLDELRIEAFYPADEATARACSE